MLQFGRELRLPIDLLLGRPEEVATITDYNETLQQRLEQVHNYARENLRLSSARMKNYYDVRADDATFEAGDAVWLHNPRKKIGHSPKLMRSWEGPYVVTKAINDVVYRIQLTQRSKPKVVHRNRLWKYAGDNKPLWFSPPTASPSELSDDVIQQEENSDAPSDTAVQLPQLRRSKRKRQAVVRFEPQVRSILRQDTSKEGAV